MKILSLKLRFAFLLIAFSAICPLITLGQHNHNHSCTDKNGVQIYESKERSLLKEQRIQDWEIDLAIEFQKKYQSAEKYAPPFKKLAPQGPGQACGNGDFELGNLNSWDAWTGDVNNANFGRVLMGAKAGRHEVVSGVTVDPYGGFPMVNPAGGSYSVRLGNDSGLFKAEVLEQTFAVTANNANFKYSYAVVLEGSGHNFPMSAKFIAGIYDMNGQLVPNSLSFEVDSGQQMPPGYFTYSGLSCPGYYGCEIKTSTGIYKPWSTVTVDLSAYIGQDVTMRFESRDCGAGGHFGYGYLDADCLLGATASIVSNKYSGQVNLYPNPANNNVNVSIGNDINYMNSSFELIDGLGRIVFTTIVDKQQFSINLVELEEGMYFYNLKAEGANVLAKGKIIKQ